MSSHSRFSDPAYIAWLRDTLALLYLKEGIEDITDSVATKFHDDLKKRLGVQACSACSPTDMVKDSRRRRRWYMNCPVCDAWLQEIISNHGSQPLPNIYRDNTNPQLWPTDPWEVLKCYMGYGCQGIRSAKDADAQNVLTLFKNCQQFATCGQIGRMDLIGELLKIRNSLLHSGNFLVNGTQLQRDLQTMLDFLAGVTPKSPVERQAVTKAVSKITELKNNTVDLTLASNRDLELRALQQKQIALDLKQQNIKTDLGALEAKSNTTESTVEKLKTDLGTMEAKSNTTETTVENLRTDLRAIKATANTTEGAVEKLRIDLGAIETKANTTEGEVKTLQTDLSSLKQTQVDNTADLEAQLQKVQSDQDQFKRFLQANNLEQDLSRLSTCVEQHERRITNLEQSQRSYERPREITEADITSLQSELVKHYRGGQSLLVPNPVVDEALDLDEIYVRSDIKVLRETSNPRAGLKTVQTNNTAGSASMCKNLFYTADYQNKQIYVAGNAGVGKTVLCKYLVNLWCQTQSKPKSDSASSKQTVNVRSSTRPEKEQNQETSQCVGLDTERDLLYNSRFEEYEEAVQRRMEEHMQAYEVQKEARIQRRKQAERKALEEEEEADKKVMAKFSLVFYISLRESSKLYTIAHMIDAQILQQIRGMSHLKAADILQTSSCLVIVDGLDEWTCPEDAVIPPFVNPGIPGRDLNSNSVFLTTTRPWKLDVLRLKGLEMDKHVELCGLNETSSKLLCSKYIDFVNNVDGTNINSQSFSAELKKKGLKRFHNVPNLLILLIGLWLDNQDLGQSRLQLFCSMLEMLLKRAAEKNLPQQSSNESDNTERLLPECFNNQPHCLDHQHLLTNLCKVAFEALLDPKREDALVFNTSQLKIFGVKPDGIDLCLKSGILTQDKVLGKRSVTEKKISFLHKQLQEMLAAVYISNRDNTEHVTTRVRHFCTTVEGVLELSQVWMFVSGIRPDLVRELLTELMTRVVLKDDKLQQYRSRTSGISTLWDGIDHTGLPRSIQTCIVDCVMEAKSNGHEDLHLPLDDFIVNGNTISSCLEHLVSSNTSTMKYVNIICSGITGVNKQILVRILSQLQHTSCLQGFHLDDVSSVVSNTSLLHKALISNKNTLTCLGLHTLTLSTEVYAAVCVLLHHVTSLKLYPVSLTHKQGEQLLSLVSQASGMRELLLCLLCTDHGYQCRPRIDLSRHSQLQHLVLYYLNVDKLPEVALCVKDVRLYYVTIAESQLRQFIHQLSSTSHSVKVLLEGVTVLGEGGNPVDLTDLRHNDKLHFIRCNYDGSKKTWSIHFSTPHRGTSESGN